MESIFAQDYFKIVKPDLGFESISKRQFVVKRKIAIDTLCPNQKEVKPLLISHKRKGNQHTTPYVLIYKGYNILMDGHHTTIAKKLNGQKFIYALTLTLNN